jgi:pseudouridine-5'-phosphate glycosidase
MSWKKAKGTILAAIDCIGDDVNQTGGLGGVRRGTELLCMEDR